MNTCSRRTFISSATLAFANTSFWASAQQSDNLEKFRWEMDISSYTHMLLPREHGQLTSITKPVYRRYPSRDHCMQMAAFFRGEKGVLVIGNDKTAGLSDWTIIPRKKLTINFYGAAPKVITINTDASIESVAQHYRAWALQQDWIRNRKRQSAELNFMTVAASSSLAVDQKNLAKLLELTQPPLGVWLTLWRQSPFDVMYPDYTPKEGFAFRRFLQQLKKNRIVAFPYINGLTWDKNNSTFRKKGESVSLLDSESHAVFYKTTMRHLLFACPCAEAWQQQILNARDNLLDLDGEASQGVYLDMLAASPPMICWSKLHGHAPGDPYAWMRGIRQLLRSTRGHIFVEGCAEVYLDLIDYPLMHLHTDKTDAVPLWRLVYGDQIPGWGWRIPAKMSRDEFQQLLPRIATFGTAAHGSPWMTPEHERELMQRQFHATALGHKN